MTKKTEQMYLVKYEDNWADEMDIAGGRVMSETKRNKYFNIFEETFKEDGIYTYYVGSNETIEYSTYNDFKERFTSSKITLEEAKTLKKLGFSEYGFFPL